MALKPNKIEYGGRTLIDLTGDNVIADALVEGYSAHDKSGEPINGTNPYEKNATNTEVIAQAEQIAQLRQILANKAAASPVVEELNVTENGTYTAPDGTDGYSPVTVNVQPKLQEKSVTPSTQAQEVKPDSGYDGMSKVNVGAVKTTELADVTIEVDANGLITATAEQSAGYVASGTTSAAKQLTTKAAATITPGTSNQTIASGTYLTGTQTIKGDSNLKAANIKSGTKIFGVTGSLTDIASNMANFYGFTKAKSGSFTLSGLQTANYTVTHNLGSVPKLVMLYTANGDGASVTSNNVLGGVMAFQTTSQAQINTNPTSSGIYMSTGLYYNYQMKFNKAIGAFASPKVGNDTTQYTMISTALASNPSGKTPINSLNASSFVIGYGVSYYMSSGTYNWLVMG